MSIKDEIIHAVRKLGYKGKVQFYETTFNRFVVFIKDVRLGIYDLDKHTFVD